MQTLKTVFLRKYVTLNEDISKLRAYADTVGYVLESCATYVYHTFVYKLWLIEALFYLKLTTVGELPLFGQYI